MTIQQEVKKSKRELIKEYNKSNENYNITDIKKVNKEHLEYLEVNGAKTLGELYQNCSNEKWDSYNAILRTYKPEKIIGLVGSSHAYSITLVADNGDTLWITHCNNYLVEEV